jgi:hypothetical protein
MLPEMPGIDDDAVLKKGKALRRRWVKGSSNTESQFSCAHM